MIQRLNITRTALLRASFGRCVLVLVLVVGLAACSGGSDGAEGSSGTNSGNAAETAQIQPVEAVSNQRSQDSNPSQVSTSISQASTSYSEVSTRAASLSSLSMGASSSTIVVDSQSSALGSAVGASSTSSVSSEAVASSFSEAQSSSVSSSLESSSSFTVSSSSPAVQVPSYPAVNTWPQAWQNFAVNLEQPLVQEACVACHQEQGFAAGSALHFVGLENIDAPYLNAQSFMGYLAGVQAGERILRKVAGFDNHGGGVVFSRNHAVYQRLERFITEQFPQLATPQQKVVAEASFEPREKTLRRAAILLAERLPSADEFARAGRSDDELEKVVKELMQGQGFKNFLMRGANDHLLTDSFLNGEFFEISNGFASYYPVGSNKRYFAYESGDIWPFEYWNNEVYHSMVRAPLELIAYTAMNDLPYTNIITADYTIGNKSTAEYMRQDVDFANGDKFDMQPFKNHGQILLQQGHRQYLDPSIGLRIDQHGDWVDYPHAGILNEPAFLARYPSSDTNRNRLRAKMVYKLFLGVDIEDLAARLTPEDLADTDNPTMNNAACAACHNTLDPVAGAFQNFGVYGWYRSNWLGLDSLPGSYKREHNSPYQKGDLWFRDMRAPGFEGQPIDDADQSLAELGRMMADDERFALAAVKFWWPAVMSEGLLPAPDNSANDEEKSLHQEQQLFISDLAEQFRAGFKSGAQYQLKDLLAAMVLSPWFRADSMAAGADNPSLSAVAGVRLLSPEELEAKVKFLVGYAWGERSDKWRPNGSWSMLDDQYRIYYGGIDSLGVTERAKAHNSVMANVAEAQAVNLACATVLLDVNRNDDEKRLLRNHSRYVSPFSHDWQRIDLARPQAINMHLRLVPGENTLRISHLNADVVGPVVIADLALTTTDGQPVITPEQLQAALILSMESGRATGVNAGDSIVLEQGYIELSFDADHYTEVNITADILTPWDWPAPAELNIDMLNYSMNSTGMGLGEQVIRQQLLELFWLTQGQQLAIDSAEVNHALDTFMALWQSLEMQETPMTLASHQHNYCDLSAQGLPDIASQNTSDPQRLLSAWSHMMVYFFTDFYFLHE